MVSEAFIVCLFVFLWYKTAFCAIFWSPTKLSTFTTCTSHIPWRKAEEAGAAGGQLLSTSCQCRLIVSISWRSRGGWASTAATPSFLLFPQSSSLPHIPLRFYTFSAPLKPPPRLLRLPPPPSVTYAFSCKFHDNILKDRMLNQLFEDLWLRMIKPPPTNPKVYTLQVVSSHQHVIMWMGCLF